MVQSINNQYQQEFTSFDLSKRITTSRIFSKIKLSPSAKLTLRCLLDFRNHKTGLTFPKQTTIAEATGLTKASINKAIEELRKAKLILTVKYNGRLNYQLTNVFLNLLSDPEESTTVDKNNLPEDKTKYNSADIKIIPYITNNTKKIKKQSLSSFKETRSIAVRKTKILMEHYKRDKETAESPYDNFDCAIDMLKMIKRRNMLKHAFARKMQETIKKTWNLDDNFIETLQTKGDTQNGTNDN